MKNALLFLCLNLCFSVSAKTYYCSFADEKMGVLQIDLKDQEVSLCQYQKQTNNEWLKVESGRGKFTNEYFDNNRYTTMNVFNVLTLKGDIQLRIAKKFNTQKNTEGAEIGITWSMASKFGPMINAGYATNTRAYCFEKPDASPCVADVFVQPKNTPKDFEKLKRILETNERDWWGDRPTFTLVSPDREEFEVFNQITENVIEACSFGCVSSKSEEIIKKRVYPKLKMGWTLVPVYSNESGIKLFRQL